MSVGCTRIGVELSSLTLTASKDFQEAFQKWRRRWDRYGVYMREGTTSRVMAADRSYGEFYDFYSVSPKYFGYTLVFWEYNMNKCLYSLHRLQTSLL
jgi:hypothetical protein